MYLVDTNVWLERLLDQTRSEEIGRFLETISSESLFITDFAFHSIGVVLNRLNQKEVFLQFIQDVFVNGAIHLIHLEPEDMMRLVHVIEQFKLDFDDAYQYVAAEKLNLIIISLDSDFDNTERKRKTPAEALKG
ncbi:type II toxin-antitoxin system VapC family toxin [candidate division TA06 bacterium]|nr:type II toxin-antitoxin system VapC family toxin [candidate division TA06 bacterium]